MSKPKRFGIYFGLAFSVLWNVLAWAFFTVPAIRAGHFVEIAGKGGPPIREITAAADPVDFWVLTLVFPVGGAVLLSVFLYKVVADRRSRRAN